MAFSWSRSALWPSCIFLPQRGPCLLLHTCGALGRLCNTLSFLPSVRTGSLLLSQGIALAPGPPASSSGSCCLSFTQQCVDLPGLRNVRPAITLLSLSPIVPTRRGLCDLPPPEPASPCSPPAQCSCSVRPSHTCLPTHPLSPQGRPPILFHQSGTLVPAHN